MTDTPPPALAGARIGPREFIALVATLMAMTALGIDSMLPALPAIAGDLGVQRANDQQWVVAVFMFGFSAGQLLWGPLSDRFGRKATLLAALALGAAANLAAAVAPDYTLLLVARAVGGIAVASSRVVAVALVRDCYSGRAMARVMSLAFIVFMAAPVLAPSVGQLILLVAPWRAIFVALTAASLATLLWIGVRLPETLREADRLPLSLTRIMQGFRFAVTERNSIGYTLASTMLMSGLYGFINSIPQVLDRVFDAEERLALIFAGVAGTMALANYFNSRIVMAVGTRRISHSALLGFILFAGVHLAFALSGAETLWSFMIVQALMMACFGLAGSNFGSMAMEHMGSQAGTASSAQGFIATALGALGGAAIGQAFDGTTIPLYTGFLIGGVLALVAVLATERGRLFTARNVMLAD